MTQHEFDVFGTAVSSISGPELALLIEDWALNSDAAGHVVCFSDAHSIVRGHDDPAMHQALAAADLVAPDGHPLAWIGRKLYGLPVKPLCGPDFMTLLMSRSPASGLSHYLFGGKPGVADELADILKVRFPGVAIVGIDSPPMGTSDPRVIEQQLARILAAKPDIVWVALGAPKQEIWMAQHRHRLGNMTLCGVGAAFDFHTGSVRRAPAWMRRHGLEWAFRWCSEPRRLGPRYRKTIPRFFVLLVKQVLRMRNDKALKARCMQLPGRS